MYTSTFDLPAIIPTIQSTDFRNQLGDVLNRVYYQGAQVRIVRKNLQMARVVPEKFMQAIDALIEQEPGLADTLALMLNEEAKQTIQEGLAEFKTGKAVPLEEAFA